FPLDRRKFDEYWNALSTRVNVKDLGEIARYVGISVIRDLEKREMSFCQSGALMELLGNFGMSDAKSRQTPMSSGLTLTKTIEGTRNAINLIVV
ncbi:MAG TPA: hypothetical protein VN843_34215, partial [Anaerolineales bacterium]|nr:hypothetical protein [Anaerolineales bacterium]